MYDMKKQIQSYRKEIIDISTTKKHHGKAKANKKDRNMKVPRLDLSKVRRDSEDGSSSGSNSQAIQKFQELDSQGKEKAYQKYMQYIEDDSRFEEMGEESQESLIRQEELKDRKNKIIQLLNGDVTDDEDGAQVVDQSSQGSMIDDNISYD